MAVQMVPSTAAMRVELSADSMGVLMAEKKAAQMVVY